MCYNPDNYSFSPGLDDYGPRIVNFADVLQYNYFPLAETISVILKVYVPSSAHFAPSQP